MGWLGEKNNLMVIDDQLQELVDAINGFPHQFGDPYEAIEEHRVKLNEKLEADAVQRSKDRELRKIKLKPNKGRTLPTSPRDGHEKFKKQFMKIRRKKCWTLEELFDELISL